MNLENKCRSNIMTSSQEVPVIPTSRIPVATTQHVPVLSSPQPVPVRYAKPTTAFDKSNK